MKIEIPVASADPAGATVDEFIAHFHQAHRQMYGYGIDSRPVVLVNCRLSVSISIQGGETAIPPHGAGPGNAGPPVPIGRRRVRCSSASAWPLPRR